MAENSGEVRVERNGHILEITIDRPKVNAIDAATSRRLGEAFVMLRDDPELAAKLARSGGELVARDYTLARYADALEALMQQCCSGGGS